MTKMMSRMVPIDMKLSPNVYVGLLQGKAAPSGAACHFVSVRKAPGV
jgi:hypothetical protein